MQINSIVAVILAGGLARRFGGVEKGLQPLHGKPMISHIIERLQPQVDRIVLNVNRQTALYHTQYPDLPCYADQLADFQGPLSGMLSGLQQREEEYLLFVPCDSPFLPHNLLRKLSTALQINHATIAYAHDGNHPQPTFALVHRSVQQALADYLARGERRILQFFLSQKSVAVDFSEQPSAFQNFNTAEALTSGQFCQTFCNIPLLGITGYSGTGKTTLLEKLIPYLSKKGIRVGLIKHSHHHLDIDKPGKDSYRLRRVGANPTMVVCEQRWAMMVETEQLAEFRDLTQQFQGNAIDLILVEGFKQESIPKIQLHRAAIPQPLPELDPFTIATATDYPLVRANVLNINDIAQIAHFICTYFQLSIEERQA